MEPRWRTSSHSAKYNCVQCTTGLWSGGHGNHTIAIRDSQNPDLGRIHTPAHEWIRFLAAIRHDEL
ncbi:DUF397 domain-containing protein [Spiractinospora alimapuensis]|uniref:DUF397 domain-containing protein n=1 Tax=Spiractinospora alimapuensis TaxID=2820884 RepID=UPI001F20D447|nr:DUF397 domain-containing protein [Spiractinospora alimapuensis]QVQ53387.1 DUF397 domain-containing protein [Spiractinospora alimapuensis]